MLERIKKWRATSALKNAMYARNETGIKNALARGANPNDVTDWLDEPAQHFQMKYEIQGALRVAGNLRLARPLIDLLVESGAKIPLDDKGHPDALHAFEPEDRAWAIKEGLIDYLNTIPAHQQLASTPSAPAASTPKRRF